MTSLSDGRTRVLPIIGDVAHMFQTLIEDRNIPKVEKIIDGYRRFLFYDDNGMSLVAIPIKQYGWQIQSHLRPFNTEGR